MHVQKCTNLHTYTHTHIHKKKAFIITHMYVNVYIINIIQMMYKCSVRMYASVCPYTHTHTHTHTSTSTHTDTNAQRLKYAHTDSIFQQNQLYMHTNVHTYIQPSTMRVYMHTYVHTCVYTCITNSITMQAYIRTYMHELTLPANARYKISFLPMWRKLNCRMSTLSSFDRIQSASHTAPENIQMCVSICTHFLNTHMHGNALFF